MNKYWNGLQDNTNHSFLSIQLLSVDCFCLNLRTRKNTEVFQIFNSARAKQNHAELPSSPRLICPFPISLVSVDLLLDSKFP